MNILLTGASGFIGRWLVKRLVAEHELFCLTRNESALLPHPNVHPVCQDLAAPIDTARLPSSVDAIIHLAQSRHYRRFPEQARDIFQVNTASTARLLDYGREAKIKTFLLASSGGVCGYQPRPIVETDPPAPLNFYLASKYAAECLVNAYADRFAAVTLRYFFVYGEGQRDMFMPSLVGRVLDGTPVIVAGKTGVTVNPIHVSDAVEATVRALHLQRSDTINVAGPDVMSVFEVAAMIGQLAGKAPVYTHEPDKGPLAMVANIEKMKLTLGISPRVSLKEGLDRLVQDIVGGGARTRP
jgi:nucleoside-diphosphate-sugar epimerase